MKNLALVVWIVIFAAPAVADNAAGVYWPAAVTAPVGPVDLAATLAAAPYAVPERPAPSPPIPPMSATNAAVTARSGRLRRYPRAQLTRAPAPHRYRCDTTAWTMHIQRQATVHRLPAALLQAVICAESGGDPRAVSPAGARGLMQLMPATARRFGVSDPFDPAQNIRAGAQYLAWLIDRMNFDLELALAGYNAGEGAVDRYGGDIPPYRETQQYIERVLVLYATAHQ